MKEQINCEKCNASGKIQGDGYMFHECSACKGKKYIEVEKKEDEPIVFVAKEEIVMDDIVIDDPGVVLGATIDPGEPVFNDDKSGIVARLRHHGRRKGSKNRVKA